MEVIVELIDKVLEGMNLVDWILNERNWEWEGGFIICFGLGGIMEIIGLD